MIAEGVTAVVAVVDLPVFLLELAAAGAVTILHMGVRHRFAHVDAARLWAGHLPGAAPEHLPVADPIPPLPPLHAEPELSRHTGHDQPTIRLPAWTPPPEPVSLPPVMAGPEPVAQDATIMAAVHNGHPSSTSATARAAAERRDPAVTGALKDAEWRAHRLINLAAVRQDGRVIAAAARAGWTPDHESNVVALPHTPAAQSKLASVGVGRPHHNSRHFGWNGVVQTQLSRMEGDLDLALGKGDSPAKDRAAFRALNRLQRKLRSDILKSQRVTSLEWEAYSGPATI